MPPISLPRIRRNDANQSLAMRGFVLRLGRSDQPVLTLADDEGKPLHVPLHYDVKTDTYSIGPIGMFLAKATRLRGLYNRAIPSVTLQETVESILKGEAPAGPDVVPEDFIGHLSDAEVCTYYHRSEIHRHLALRELERRYEALATPHRPLAREVDGEAAPDVVHYFEEATRLDAMGVVLTAKRPVVEQLVEAASYCLHRVRTASRYLGRLPTDMREVDNAAFILGLVGGESLDNFDRLAVLVEVYAHRGDTREAMSTLARLVCAMPSEAAYLARRVACIAAEQDRGPLLKLVATLYPVSVEYSDELADACPLHVAVMFARPTAVRSLLEAGMNLPRRLLLQYRQITLDTLTRLAHDQAFATVVQTSDAHAFDLAWLERRLEVIAWCLDAAP